MGRNAFKTFNPFQRFPFASPCLFLGLGTDKQDDNDNDDDDGCYSDARIPEVTRAEGKS